MSQANFKKFVELTGITETNSSEVQKQARPHVQQHICKTRATVWNSKLDNKRKRQIQINSAINEIFEKTAIHVV